MNPRHNDARNVSFEGGFALWQVDHAYQTIFGSAANDTGQLGRQNIELYFEIGKSCHDLT